MLAAVRSPRQIEQPARLLDVAPDLLHQLLDHGVVALLAEALDEGGADHLVVEVAGHFNDYWDDRERLRHLVDATQAPMPPAQRRGGEHGYLV